MESSKSTAGMFWGFMSRCTTPWSWACCKARAICTAFSAVRSQGRRATLQVSIQSVWYVLHNYVWSTVFYLEIMNSGDIGVIEPGGQLGLSLEGFQVAGVISDRLVYDLYRNDAI